MVKIVHCVTIYCNLNFFIVSTYAPIIFDRVLHSLNYSQNRQFHWHFFAIELLFLSKLDKNDLQAKKANIPYFNVHLNRLLIGSMQFSIHERIFSLIKYICVEMNYYFFTVILYKYMHHCFNCKLFYLSGPSFFTWWHLFMWKMHFELSYMWVAVRVMGYPLSRLTPLWKINKY